MNFFLFAAGLGTRLRPLTLSTPKPLLSINGQTLLGRLLEQILPHAETVFINISWLGEQIEAFIHTYYANANIILLKEESPLETGGAMMNALEYEKKHHLNTTLSTQPFATVNTDIFTDYNFATLTKQKLSADTLAHLVLVNRPNNREQGDFNLTQGRVSGNKRTRGNLVFSGISLLHPALLSRYQPHRLLNAAKPKKLDNKFSLAQALYDASSQNQLSGEHFQGLWHDVGTQESLHFVATHHGTGS